MNTHAAQDFDTQASTLKALADPMRLRIVHTLSRCEEATVTQLMTELGIEQSHMSHNLTKMKDRGIVKSRRKGKQMYYSLTNKVNYQSLTGQFITLTF